MMIDRRSVLVGLGAGLAAGLAAPRAGAQPAGAPADWDKVVAAAKKEGRVLVYSGAVGQPSSHEIGRLFEAKFGIPVDFLEARASELRERIRSETTAGRFLGDVMFSSSSQTTLIAEVDHAIDPLPPIPNAGRVRKEMQTDAPMYPTQLTPYGILINTTLVPPDQEPKSWHDLLDPKWKGKILSDDTRAVGGGSLFFFATYLKWGPEFHQKLAAQNLMFTRNQRLAFQRVARGEYPIYIPFTLPDITSLEGLPVKAIVPTEGVTYVLYGNSLLRNAPRPNAARLYLDFCLSDEAEAVFAREGRVPAVASVLDMMPPKLRAFGDAPLLGTSEPKRQNEMLQLATKIYANNP